CRLLVGVDGHHLRDEDEGPDGDTSDGASDAMSTTSDVTQSSDASVDAPIVGTYKVTVLASGRTRPAGLAVTKVIGNNTYYAYWFEEAPSDGGSTGIYRIPDYAKPAAVEPLAVAANPHALRFD